jgi:polygalacturonase
LDEPGVKNVTVKSATFSKTQNGFRIKSWGKPSGGFVRHVHFVDAIMIDVQNPIIIDQNYCPFYKGCPNEVSFSFGRLLLNLLISLKPHRFRFINSNKEKQCFCHEFRWVNSNKNCVFSQSILVNLNMRGF